MSETTDSSPLPNPAPAGARPAADRRLSCSGCLLGLSLFGNLVAFAAVGLFCLFQFGGSDDSGPREAFHSGNRKATAKVAIVSVEGILLEGLVSSIHKEIDQAGKDDKVKAVVLRINSPGGSVTASEELYQRIVRLRDGDEDLGRPARPLVVSMGGVAASGGYYLAVPGSTLLAEPTTTTGSIGVYISLPNVHQFTDKHGFRMVTVKAGEIKDAGSAFKEFSERDRQVYQDLVNEMYSRFLDVVSKERKKLSRARLLEHFTVQPSRPDPQAANQPPARPYTRYRADGGVFFAPRARELDLVDAIGDLDAAVKAAAKLANLAPDKYKVIEYQKPRFSFLHLLGQQQALAPGVGVLEPDRLHNALSPRVWYLAPGHDAAALAAAARSNP